MVTTESGADPRSFGLFQSLRGHLGTWVDVLRTRLELLSTELQEERLWMQRVVVLAVASIVCFAFGALLVTLFVVVAFWETDYRLVVVGGFALLYLLGGVVAALVARRRMRDKPKLLSATIGELAKDIRHLTS
jgi:uncharacterized membrane protein YqjE